MKTAIGLTLIRYQVDCPYCEETQYSNYNSRQWGNLEWGDGKPHGTIKCDDCLKEFEMEIGDEII